MESQNYLGIHISAETATVVCLGARGHGRSILGGFSVALSPDREKNLNADMSELVRLIADGIAERKLTFGEATVAVDCSLFMQHSVHSEFKDRKQIAQTVRFDTEDALSSDIAEVAVAFRVVSSDENGSGLSVFTIQRSTFRQSCFRSPRFWR